MSDFFKRIAEVNLGTVHLIQPLTSPRFAPGPVMLDDVSRDIMNEFSPSPSTPRPGAGDRPPGQSSSEAVSGESGDAAVSDPAPDGGEPGDGGAVAQMKAGAAGDTPAPSQNSPPSSAAHKSDRFYGSHVNIDDETGIPRRETPAVPRVPDRRFLRRTAKESDAAPRVRVNIGRIKIDTTDKPTPPRRAFKRPKASLSLKDYLDHRRRNRSRT